MAMACVAAVTVVVVVVGGVVGARELHATAGATHCARTLSARTQTATMRRRATMTLPCLTTMSCHLPGLIARNGLLFRWKSFVPTTPRSMMAARSLGLRMRRVLSRLLLAFVLLVGVAQSQEPIELTQGQVRHVCVCVCVVGRTDAPGAYGEWMAAAHGH